MMRGGRDGIFSCKDKLAHCIEGRCEKEFCEKDRGFIVVSVGKKMFNAMRSRIRHTIEWHEGNGMTIFVSCKYKQLHCIERRRLKVFF